MNRQFSVACVVVAASILFVSQSAGAVSPLTSPLQSPIDAPRIGRHDAAPGLMVIGNSIAIHGPYAALGWDGNWGMAASSQERDFAHVLAARMGATVDVASIAPLEREAANLPAWLPNAQANAGHSADVLVIKIGDNVLDPVAFESALGVYLDMVRGNARLICVGTWYPKRFDVDGAIARACEARGGRFVKIVDLFYDARYRADSERLFASGVVGSHPGDAGMAAIADRVYTAIVTRRYWFPIVVSSATMR